MPGARSITCLWFREKGCYGSVVGKEGRLAIGHHVGWNRLGLLVEGTTQTVQIFHTEPLFDFTSYKLIRKVRRQQRK